MAISERRLLTGMDYVKQKKKYTGLDGIRAIACLTVVLVHVFTNAKYDVHGFLFSQGFRFINNVVLMLFMTVSGFGMCCGYYDRMLNREIDIVDFYKKRYKKILPFFGLLCVIDLIISPSLSSLYEVFANLTLCFGLIPNADIKVIGVGWFLGTVFAFYLLFPFFVFLLADKKRAWLSFFASIIMNYLCQHYFDADRKSIAFSFVHFMVGGMVFLYRDKVTESKKIEILEILIMVLSALAFFMGVRTTVIVLIFNAAALIYAIGVSDKNILNAKAFKVLGGVSFEVYLCHMLIFRVLEKMNLLRLFSNDYLNYLIVYIIVIVGAMIFATITQKLINKVFVIIDKRRNK